MAIYSIRSGSDDGRQAYITGNYGRYNDVVFSPRVKYARNAINNFHQYAAYRMPKVKYPDLSDISKLSDDKFEKKMAQLSDSLEASRQARKSMPPMDYTIKYLPGKVDVNTVDTVALLGAAYEDMGRKLSVGTEALTKSLQKTFKTDKASAAALDLDKDGRIDVAEYASSILAADMLSSGSLSEKDINGQINKDGHLRLLSFFNKRNNYLPERVFGHLYDFFALDNAKEEFMKNPNHRAR